MYKKIFVSENGDLIEFLKGCDRCRLASSYEMMESVCEGNSPILGVVQCSDGLFIWTDNLENELSIQDIGEVCEYIKIGEIPVVAPISMNKENNGVNKVIVENLLVASIMAVTIIVMHIFIFIFKKGLIG